MLSTSIAISASALGNDNLADPVTLGPGGSWYLRGEIKAAFIADTIYNDPTLTVARTEVFGSDGRDDPDGGLGSDTSVIPIDLNDDIGVVEEDRPIAGDLPEFGITFLGSGVELGTAGDNYKVLLDAALANPRAPYVPELHRLWLEYRYVALGLGWSTFMDFKKDERGADAGNYFPETMDYTGPPGYAYNRQLALRFKFSPRWYLGLEDPSEMIYLAPIPQFTPLPSSRSYTNYPNSDNSDSVYRDERLRLQDSNNNIRTYEISRQLRSRESIPDIILTYYGAGNKHNLFTSLLVQSVNLDSNSPLLLDSDPGLVRLTRDADEEMVGGEVREAADRLLNLNDDLSGGLSKINTALNLGLAGQLGRQGRSSYNLAYIYNGGRYLRDNPNPHHVVVQKDPDDPNCPSSSRDNKCEYELVNIVSHSYLLDFVFAQRYGLIFSGTVTDDDYGRQIGGAATKQVHTTYFNYRRPSRVAGLSTVYEFAYKYRQTFNTRNNAAYPRLRFGYGLTYNF